VILAISGLAGQVTKVNKCRSLPPGIVLAFQAGEGKQIAFLVFEPGPHPSLIDFSAKVEKALVFRSRRP